MRPPLATPSPSRRLRILVLRALVASLALPSAALSAATFYWGSDTTLPADPPPSAAEIQAVTNWKDATHWYTDAAGTTPASAFPDAADDAIFSIDSLTATALDVRVYSSDLSVRSITFNNTAAINLTGGGGNRTVNLGSGGITLNAGSAAVTLGTATANRNVFARVAASQTWTNNSNSTFNVRNSGGASNLATGTVTLTLSANGSGAISNSGAFSDAPGGNLAALAIVVDSAGTGVASMGSGTYTGGTLIRRGVLQSGGNVGAISGAVLLGDTGSSANATLRLTGTSVGNNITVQARSGGSSRLELNASSDMDLTGNITLNHALQVVTAASRSQTISGNISGDSGLSKEASSSNNGVLILGGDNTYSGNTTVNAGTLNLRNDGSLTFYIGANGVNNAILGTGTLLLNGSFNFDFSSAELVAGNTWNIVNGALTKTYADTFAITGFTETNNVWSNGSFSFSEANGQLTYVPEGSHLLLIGLSLGLFSLGRRRRLS